VFEVSTIGLETSAGATEFLPRSPTWGSYQSFRRYCKNNFFELTKIFCFNVKETGLRAIVDSVIIIFKIWNQDIVAMCIMGCGKKKFRNIPLVNNPVYRAIKLICNRVIHESEIVCRFLKHRLHLGHGLLDMTRDSYPALGVSKMFVISKWHLTGAPKLTFERKLKA
jgi:hypothetical protein